MPSRIDEMSDEEIELRLALLERQRQRAPVAAVAGEKPLRVEPVAVPQAAEAAPVVRIAGRKAPKNPPEERWFHVTKVCPHCGKEKNVGREFGVIVSRGIQYAASWCNQCRSETSGTYRSAPRKNRTKYNPDAPPKPKRVRKKTKK